MVKRLEQEEPWTLVLKLSRRLHLIHKHRLNDEIGHFIRRRAMEIQDLTDRLTLLHIEIDHFLIS
jgi:hypothetical protein